MDTCIAPPSASTLSCNSSGVLRKPRTFSSCALYSLKQVQKKFVDFETKCLRTRYGAYSPEKTLSSDART